MTSLELRSAAAELIERTAVRRGLSREVSEPLAIARLASLFSTAGDSRARGRARHGKPHLQAASSGAGASQADPSQSLSASAAREPSERPHDLNGGASCPDRQGLTRSQQFQASPGGGTTASGSGP
jgi:hypothetical protein